MPTRTSVSIRRSTWRTGYRTRSLLCMPIVAKAVRVIGVMEILNRKVGAIRRRRRSARAERVFCTEAGPCRPERPAVRGDQREPTKRIDPAQPLAMRCLRWMRRRAAQGSTNRRYASCAAGRAISSVARSGASCPAGNAWVAGKPGQGARRGQDRHHRVDTDLTSTARKRCRLTSRPCRPQHERRADRADMLDAGGHHARETSCATPCRAT